MINRKYFIIANTFLFIIFIILICILIFRNKGENKSNNESEKIINYPTNYLTICPINCPTIKPSPVDLCSLENTMDPKYCIGVDILQSNNCPKDDNCQTDSKDQCALELIIGDKMHMTIAYICNCPSDKDKFLQDLIQYIKNNWKASTNINIILGNMMSGWFENNSRCIVGELADLKTFVMNYLKNQNICMTVGIWGKTPHSQVLFDDGCRQKYNSVNILDIKNWKI